MAHDGDNVRRARLDASALTFLRFSGTGFTFRSAGRPPRLLGLRPAPALRPGLRSAPISIMESASRSIGEMTIWSRGPTRQSLARVAGSSCGRRRRDTWGNVN